MKLCGKCLVNKEILKWGGGINNRIIGSNENFLKLKTENETTMKWNFAFMKGLKNDSVYEE